jgi:hypothetical protein
MLKKTMVFVLLVFVLNVFAQDDIGAGTYAIGGGLSAETVITHGDDDLTSKYNLSPDFYIFLNKNIAIGGTLDFGYYSHGDNNYISYGIGPGIKFYFHPSKKFKINFGTQYSYSSKEQNDYSSWYLSLFAGVDIFIAKNVALEPYVQFKRADANSNYYNYPWTFEIREGVRIAVFVF